MTDDDRRDEDTEALLELKERVEAEIADREELADDPYPFADSNDKSLRCFVLDKLGSSDIDGRILIANMDMVYRWIQHDELPRPHKEQRLKAVSTQPGPPHS